MSPANEPAVLGVDACPRGWVGIVLDASGRFARAVTEATIGGLVATAGDIAVVARRAATGSGLSKQAWALRPKLLEVDRWLREGTGVRVVEVHPEVSFATMNGSPLTARKRTWTGLTTRRVLLAHAGIELPDDLGAAGERAESPATRAGLSSTCL